MCEIGLEEWIFNRYDAKQNNMSHMDKTESRCKELFSCAYREYNPQKGATGGPGGMLHMQEMMVGKKLKDVKLRYLYKPEEYRVPDKIWSELSDLNGKVKTIIAAAGYLISNSQVYQSLVDGNHPMMICHDIGCAYGANLLHIPYVLIYHQQGSILNEICSSGVAYSKEDMRVTDYIEKRVFLNAEQVYFPSLGAEFEFKITTHMSEKDLKQVKFSRRPLYNSLPENESAPISDHSILKKLGLHVENVDEIFLSIGDYNLDKGIDQIPDFLNQYCGDRKILWIVAGNISDKGIYQKLVKDRENWKFQSVLFSQRLPHEDILQLMNISDYYIMLHRKSIFDLATLEAMRAGNGIILSNCKANYEFNVNHNVLIVNMEDRNNAVYQLQNSNLLEWKRNNSICYQHYFSNLCFRDRYLGAIYDFLTFKDSTRWKLRSEINHNNFKSWKGKLTDQKVVICGSGSSLDDLTQREDNTFYIALNKALFYQNIHFDCLFMQDAPVGEHQLSEYNHYDCVKFYGMITNSEISVQGLGDIQTQYENVTNKIYRYELSPYIFEHRIEKFESEIDQYCLSDAQSVLFSALQFAVVAGCREIKLCGVDFSGWNYGNIVNESRYARNVIPNLIQFKKEMIQQGIEFGFLSTNNDALKKEFYSLDHEQAEMTVTGIYTQNYKEVVKLQIQSCSDDYRFDFRYITDEEWNRSKTSNEFAFFGGNTIKTQLVIDKIIENMGKIIIVTDADVIFLKETKKDLLWELKDYDMLFLKERRSGEHLFAGAMANINIGFVVMRCNEQTLRFWQQVQEQTELTKGWDQEIVNKMICDGKTDLQYKLLSDDYLNGGSITKDNIADQHICTACGTIAKKNNLSKLEFLVQAMKHYREGEWF